MELQTSNSFSDISPEIIRLAKMSEQAGTINPDLYTKYDVKRGLRDLNGKGVLAGLTNISDVRATEIVNGQSVPAHGKLFYRGYPSPNSSPPIAAFRPALSATLS